MASPSDDVALMANPRSSSGIVDVSVGVKNRFLTCECIFVCLKVFLSVYLFVCMYASPYVCLYVK